MGLVTRLCSGKAGGYHCWRNILILSDGEASEVNSEADAVLEKECELLEATQ